MKPTDTNAGRYHSSQDIPADTVERESGNYSMTRKQSQEEVMQRLLETMARIEKAAANDRRAAEEARRQTANQLAEIVRRTGQLETTLGLSVSPLPPAGPPPVTDEEAQVKGSKFWVITNSSGKRTAQEVVVASAKQDLLTGSVEYEWRRTDGVSQGSKGPRSADQLFRSEEDALTYGARPTPSSARNRKVSISMKTTRKTTLPSNFGRPVVTTTLGSDE